MSDIVFSKWPKTPRLFRDMIITEKLDGTNAGVGVILLDGANFPNREEKGVIVDVGPDSYLVYAQSRNRVITPEADNFGFAGWVHTNAAELVAILGPGMHFGEWWGSGIQKRYGLGAQGKTFSLFNTAKWGGVDKVLGSARIGSVPVLWRGPFSTPVVKAILELMKRYGSVAVPGYDAEGICVYHGQSDQIFKVSIDNDLTGKGR